MAKLKLFVWPDLPPQWRHGPAFAFARSLRRAKDAVVYVFCDGEIEAEKAGLAPTSPREFREALDLLEPVVVEPDEQAVYHMRGRKADCLGDGE